MPTKISKELKEAILHMPEREKDKLLIRLINKDQTLISKLQYELLEGEGEMERRRQEIADSMEEVFSRDNFPFWHDTPGLLMMVMRDFSGDINRHIKITKDKYGEVELFLKLINLAFSKQFSILKGNEYRAEKFADYTCRKAQLILRRLEKMDSDYYLDFEKPVNEMLGHLHGYFPTQYRMKNYGLPQEWTY
ncbi:MAG: hypothetical protein ACLFUB_14105 [Cyclobacteriaceae bacterium]